MANQRGLSGEVELNSEVQQLMRTHFEDETTQAYQVLQEFEKLQKEMTRENEDLFSQCELLQQLLSETKEQLRFHDDVIERNNHDIQRRQDSIANFTRVSQQLEIKNAERELISRLRAAINNALVAYNKEHELFLRVSPAAGLSHLLDNLNVVIHSNMDNKEAKQFYNKFLYPEIKKSFPQFGKELPFYWSEGKGRPSELKMIIEDHKIDIKLARKILPQAQPDEFLLERVDADHTQIQNLQFENHRHLLNKHEKLKEYKSSFIPQVQQFVQAANAMAKLKFDNDLDKCLLKANELFKNIKKIKNDKLDAGKESIENSIFEFIKVVSDRGKNIVVDDNFSEQKNMILSSINEKMLDLEKLNSKLEKNQKRKQDLLDEAKLALLKAEEIQINMREELRNPNSLREELVGNWDARLKKYFVDEVIVREELNRESANAAIVSPLIEIKNDVRNGINEIKEFVNELGKLSITDAEFSIKIKDDKAMLNRIKEFPHLAYETYKSRQRRNSNQHQIEESIKPAKDFFDKLQDLIKEIEKENQSLNAKLKSSSTWARYGVSEKTSAITRSLEAALNNLSKILEIGKENNFSNESELLNHFLNFKVDAKTPSIKEALQQKRHGFFSNPKSYERICEKFNISAPGIKNVKKL